MLKGEGEILCDDRIIVRRWPDGVKIHGTWSHGDIPDVSNSSAPLRAIFFLEKSQENAIEPIDKHAVIRMLPLYVSKAPGDRGLVGEYPRPYPPHLTGDTCVSSEAGYFRESGLLDEFLQTDPGKQ